MEIGEVLGVILVPLLIFIFTGHRKRIDRLEKKIDYIISKCDKCKNGGR